MAYPDRFEKWTDDHPDILIRRVKMGTIKTITDAAKFFQVSRECIYYWCDTNYEWREACRYMVMAQAHRRFEKSFGRSKKAPSLGKHHRRAVKKFDYDKVWIAYAKEGLIGVREAIV